MQEDEENHDLDSLRTESDVSMTSIESEHKHEKRTGLLMRQNTPANMKKAFGSLVYPYEH